MRRVVTRPEVPAPIGVAVPRRDGIAKVTGAARFTVDVDLPGLAHARILRSPYPHARILSVDARAARAHPGVIAVVSAEDLADVHLVYGHAVADHPLIAVDKVRFAGEPVVGVVAEDAVTADEALRLIDVAYEPLPFVQSPEAALAADAPIIHEKPGEQRPHRGFEEDIDRTHANVCSSSRQHVGRRRRGVRRRRRSCSRASTATRCATRSRWSRTRRSRRGAEGELTVWTSGQHPYMVRDDLAHCFDLPLAQDPGDRPVRRRRLRQQVVHEDRAADRCPRPARRSARPPRAERRGGDPHDPRRRARSSGSGPPSTRDGRILGRQGTILLDTGGYAENSPLVGRKAANRIGGPYRIPALDVTCDVVYTNTAPASSFRGFGAPQVTLAGESQTRRGGGRAWASTRSSSAAGTCSRPRERPWPKVRGIDADLAADLALAAEELEWDVPPAAGRGKAIALSASDAGSEPITTSILRVLSDGSVTVMAGSTEIGQGSSTVLAQIAAAEMGVELERVRLVQSDTAMVSYDRSTGASRTTTLMGLAIQAAARGRPCPAASTGRRARWRRTARPSSRRAAASGSATRPTTGARSSGPGSAARRGEVVGRGYLRKAGATEEMPPFWEIGCVGVEVSVDEPTGEIRVERLVTVGDIGCAINPQTAEAQDVGAAMMGLGMATREELVYRDGNLMNGNLFDYRVPRTTNLPELRTVLVERGDGVGVYGAKGGGEGALNPVAAAIANAVERAGGHPPARGAVHARSGSGGRFRSGMPRGRRRPASGETAAPADLAGTTRDEARRDDRDRGPGRRRSGR